MKSYRKYLIFLTVLCGVSIFSQNFKRGLILPKISEPHYPDKFCCVLSPTEGFAVYDQPSGKVIGKIARVGNVKNDDQVAYHLYLVKTQSQVELENLVEVGYEIRALKYVDSKKGFVKIQIPNSAVWLKISELQKQGFEPVNWLYHLIKNSDHVLGYYANEPGLQIRKEPNISSEIMGSVRGELFEIKLTSEVSGQWCKVKVTKYREHPCNTDLTEDKNIEFHSEGWIKIIDDQGESNLWSYPRGC